MKKSLVLCNFATSELARYAQLSAVAFSLFLCSSPLLAQSDEGASALGILPPVIPPSTWSPLVSVDDYYGEVNMPYTGAGYKAMVNSHVWGGEGVLIGVSGKAVGTFPANYRQFIGVRGEGSEYGLYGELAGNRSGAALFSTVYPNDATVISGRYAGYFHGNVYATDDIVVEGSLTAPSLYGNLVESPSDGESSFHETASVTSRLSGVRTASLESASAILAAREEDVEARGAVHYALSAQDIEECFPEIMKTDEDGTRYVNYMELIPLLVQAINELKAEVDELKGVRSPSRPMKSPAAQATGVQSSVTSPAGTIQAYDLQGRKTSAAKQGVIIRDGQKVWVK